MAKLEMFVDKLAMDVAEDLERIDTAMTRLIQDRSLQDRFKADPAGVMVAVGMHPPAAPEVLDRMNRIFYATLSNKPLLDFVAGEYATFSPASAAANQQYHLDGLAKGKIQDLLTYDLEAFDHIARRPEAMRTMFQLSLYDLNDRGILTKQYTREELDAYIEQVVEATVQRRPLSESPILESYDRNHGIGKKIGALRGEVGPVATAAAGVEVVVAITVAIPVFVFGVVMNADAAAHGAPQLGDIDLVRARATLARIMDFGADLMLHVAQFEQR